MGQASAHSWPLSFAVISPWQALRTVHCRMCLLVHRARCCLLVVPHLVSTRLLTLLKAGGNAVTYEGWQAGCSAFALVCVHLLIAGSEDNVMNATAPSFCNSHLLKMQPERCASAVFDRLCYRLVIMTAYFRLD